MPQGGVPGTGPLAPPGLRLQSEARSPLQEIGRQWASPKPFLQLHPCPHTALGPHWAAATSPSSSPPLTSAPPARPLSSQCGSQGGARWASYEDLGQGIGTGAGDEGLAGVAGHGVDRLLVFLTVGRDLLHARLVVQAPQAQGAVMACTDAGLVQGTVS